MRPFRMSLNQFARPYLRYQRWVPGAVYAFIFSLSNLIFMFNELDRSTDFLEELRPLGKYVQDDFDFIIVGCGSSGSLLANRLSEQYSVLVLEAGGDPHPIQLIPMMATSIPNERYVDWRIKTVPQEHSTFAQNNKESLLSAGLSLGGTSNINYMIQSRGNPKDFDTWAAILGDPDWAYDNLIPYFKKHENFVRKSDNFKSDEFDENIHGHGGELNVEVPAYTNLASTFLEATQELGYKQADLNGRYTEGFDYTYYTAKFGRRLSAYTAFLERIQNRRTLTIRKFAHVKKVLFQDENKAYGVNYDHHGIPRTAYAKREVILSAGALNTPKLLMLSGIGPNEHLQDLGIPVVQDLPVGRNLQDHAAIYLGPFFVNQSIEFNPDKTLGVADFANYFSRGQGPLSNTGCSAMGFISSRIAQLTGEKDYPDVQLVLVGTNMCKECDRLLAKAFNINETIAQKYYEHAKQRDSFLIFVSNARPSARGYVKLKDTDAYSNPIVDPRYLDNSHDVLVTIEGMKKAIEIVEETKTFQKLGGHFTDVPFPGCEEEEFRSHKYWECYARQFTISYHHLVGTCSMGISPKIGVVNSKLQVFGIRNLRIVDASVMPKVPVGNTNAPTYMIAEKAADLILKTWEGKEPEKRKRIISFRRG